MYSKDLSVQGGWLSRAAWWPVPLCLIALAALDPPSSSGAVSAFPLPLHWALAPYLPAALLLAALAARDARPITRPGILLLAGGAGCLGVFFGLFQLRAVSDPEGARTALMVLAWLAALCHLVGARYVLAAGEARPEQWTGRPAAVYTAVLAIAVATVFLTTTEWVTGVYFATGDGGFVRRMVLALAIFMQVGAAVWLWESAAAKRSGSRFCHWYALGLLLIATGWFGLLLHPWRGLPLHWGAVTALLLGGVYLNVAALAAIREQRRGRLPTEADCRFDDLFDLAADGMALYELRPASQVRILRANSAFCALLGGAVDEHRTPSRSRAAGRPAENLLSTLEVERLRRDGETRFENVLTAGDGRQIPVEIRSRLCDRSQPGRILSIVRDMSEHKQVEAHLRQSHEALETQVRQRTAELSRTADALRMERQRFLDMLDMMPVYVILLTKDYRVVLANRYFEQRFGNFMGRRCHEHLFNRDAPCENCETFKVFSTGGPLSWEWTGPDGRIYDIYDFPFTDVDGSPLVMEMGLDITDRRTVELELAKHRDHLESLVAERTARLGEANAQLQAEIAERHQVEVALQQSREDLSRAQEVGQIGWWRMDTRRNVLTWSDETCRIFGVSPGTPLSYESFLAFVHPDDRPYLEAKWQAAIRGEPYDIEHRAMVNGGVKWVREKAYLEFDAAGELLGGFGIAQDITDRKLAEQLLRESEERLRLFIEHAPVALAMFDRDMHYLAVSRRWIADFDLAGRDLLGRSHYALFPEMSEQWKASHLRGLAGETVKLGEDRWEREDGVVRWLRWAVRPWYRDDATVGGIIIFTEDITENKRAAEALRESEEKFRSAFANAAIGFAMATPAGRVLDANPAYCTLTGYTLDELKGREFAQLIHPDDREENLWLLGRMLSGAINDFVIENRYIRNDGQVVWVRKSNSLVRDAEGAPQWIIALVENVTERNWAEAALRESETRFRTLFESSSDALMLLDELGYADCNQATLRMFGCQTRQDFVGKDMVQFSPPVQPGGLNTPELADERIRTALKTGSLTFDWQYRRPDGTEFPAEVLLSRIELENRTLLQATVRDITERKAMLAALAEARSRAEQASRLKSLFLANMSHEIRTPMNAIMGLTELCLLAEPDSRQWNYLNKIKGASEALLRIIDDILDFSKIEAGRLEMVEEGFSLANVFDTVASLLQGKARDKGLELGFLAGDGVQGTYIGDGQRLVQVLVNLVGNAIKFSHRGRIEVSVEESASEDGRAILAFAVRDEGIGISAEEQAVLFQPFTQADSSATRSYGGTGLGLAISKRLVELMNGHIGVESTPGQGSVFRFSVKVQAGGALPPAGRARRDRLDHAGEARLAELRGAEILLVEDAELNQDVMRELLEQCGFRVRLAANGAEALRQVAAARPDCVLMDCQMPVMDGYEASRRLRAQDWGCDLPIIALTANAMAGDRERCFAAGMDGFVAKPVNLPELLAVLVRWIKPRNAAAAAPDAVAAPSLAEAALPELPGIDGSIGLARVGGRADFYLGLLKRFRDTQASGFRDRFRAALTAGDVPSAILEAHTLKGLALTLGAGQVGDLAARLEVALEAGDTAAAREWQGALESELDRVLTGLAGLDGLGTGQPPPAQAGGESPDALLQRLRRLLADRDTAAVEAIGLLEQALAGSPHAAAASCIGQAIARYDFATAEALLRDLVQSLGWPEEDERP